MEYHAVIIFLFQTAPDGRSHGRAYKHLWAFKLHITDGHLRRFGERRRAKMWLKRSERCDGAKPDEPLDSKRGAWVGLLYDVALGVKPNICIPSEPRTARTDYSYSLTLSYIILHFLVSL